MRSRALSLLVLLGCGGRDVNLGDAHTSDAGLGPFAPPVLLPLPEGDGDDDDPALTADGTLLLFNSLRTGGQGREDIWFAVRSGTDAAFRAPEPAVELNTPERETGIALAPNGLTVWFSSDRPGGSGGLDVYVARRDGTDAPWQAPTRVVELASAGDDLVSAVDGAGTTLYLARREAQTADYDLFVAVRDAEDEPFATPARLAPFATEAQETDAFPFAEGSALVFTRDQDLVEARASESGFEGFDLLAELNSDADDRDAWLSADGTRVVFSSNRSGSYRLYQSTR
jgi:hypothetical protein